MKLKHRIVICTLSVILVGWVQDHYYGPAPFWYQFSKMFVGALTYWAIRG